MRTSLRITLISSISFLIAGCRSGDQFTLVEEGQTEYSIFLDPAAPQTVRLAAGDLKEYFGKVTGASPEMIISEQVPENPFISLGNTVAARDEGLSAEDIPIDGYRMLTREGNIFIFGPDTPDGVVNSKGGITRGTSNGIYTFIEDYLGVRWVMPGEIGEEYTLTKTLQIPAFDRQESSPFDRRVIFFRNNDPIEDEWDRRMKLGEVCAIKYGHNWIETVPPSLYDEHPEWFAMEDGRRVPPIGKYYKLESTNQEMVRYFADQVIEAFREDPDRKWYSLTPSDGGGWSDSPESMALVEKDPFGNLSRTPLIIKFYNDVARIVGEEFPDRWLGGLLYGNKGGFRYPPREGLEIEPNLALMIPNGPAYGFRLYRDFAQDNWADSIWIPEWSELSKEYGFDIYYDDYVATLVQPNGIICPPAPELLNITFSGIHKYDFKGANIAGNPVWPVYAPGNYAMAKLFWDPRQDAHDILHDYYRDAYGREAGVYIEELYHLLDTAFSNFYKKNLKAAWSLQEFHHTGIYAPHYRDIEDLFLRAYDAAKEPRYQQRLEKFGQVLSLLQWNLKDMGFFPEDYESQLTRSHEEIDRLIAEQGEEGRITRKISIQPESLKVEAVQSPPGTRPHEAAMIPVQRGGINMLLHTIEPGEVSIKVDAFNKRAEFVQYLLTDASGEQVSTGAISQGRTIRFEAEGNRNYFLKIPYRQASGRLKVEGAAPAYKLPEKGLYIDGGYIDGRLTVYFYVPAGVKGFSMIMGRQGPLADIISPEGKLAGQLDNRQEDASYLFIPMEATMEGFWKAVIHEFDGVALISLDQQLPQWFLPDPEGLLIISSAEQSSD